MYTLKLYASIYVMCHSIYSPNNRALYVYIQKKPLYNFVRNIPLYAYIITLNTICKVAFNATSVCYFLLVITSLTKKQG